MGHLYSVAVSAKVKSKTHRILRQRYHSIMCFTKNRFGNNLSSSFDNCRMAHGTALSLSSLLSLDFISFCHNNQIREFKFIFRKTHIIYSFIEEKRVRAQSPESEKLLSSQPSKKKTLRNFARPFPSPFMLDFACLSDTSRCSKPPVPSFLFRVTVQVIM